ncbi:MAG: hypothetical protein P9M00_10715 [Candidatus Tritonobacter lacicola]|nr:hypothetical protein [Candidatus Tritonobacter lacicola]
MACPPRARYPGAYYHVTHPGNERRRIFYDEEDYSIFIVEPNFILSIGRKVSEDGSFELGPIPPGRNMIYMFLDEKKYELAEINIKAGETLHKDFALIEPENEKGVKPFQ